MTNVVFRRKGETTVLGVEFSGKAFLSKPRRPPINIMTLDKKVAIAGAIITLAGFFISWWIVAFGVVVILFAGVIYTQGNEIGD